MRVFFRNCSHILTRTQGEKFEDMFLVKIASKKTSSSKGLKFIPTPTSINKTELSADIKKFNRRMRLKEFFQKNENDSDDNTTDTEHDYRHRDFRKPSTFTPKAGESLP